MRIERIRIQAFGRLRDFDTGPEPLGDLVVVLGPNEAGKTTLFQFLATALYGFAPASRDGHPYAPWSGAEPAGIAHLRLGDGTALEVHRRLLSAPSGSVVRAGRVEELRNKPIPAAEHVPAAVFRQVYAITLAELDGLAGESWARIQDRLLAGLGAADLRPARLVAEELEEEAGELWRPNRRGHQRLRRLRDGLRELEARRRDVVDTDRTLRDKVRERERTRAELEDARAEREAFEVYVERFRALQPVRAALQRVAALRAEAGDPAPLADLPLEPERRLVELSDHVEEQAERFDNLIREMDAPRKRGEALQPADRKLLEQRAEVERVAARVAAAGWMRARAGQLEQELRELNARLEHEASEVFDLPWARLDPDRVRALPAAQLRVRAAVLEDARAHTRARREAALRLAEAEGRARTESPLLSAAAGVSGLVLGLALLGTSWATGRRALALAGAVLVGAGAILWISAAAGRRVRRAGAAPPDLGPVEEREAEALRAFAEPLEGLPVRGALLAGAPMQIAAGVERLQQTIRERERRETESIGLRQETAALFDEVSRLAAACAISVPADPVPAAHLLTAAVVEATRRQATAERAAEELARLERARGREEEALARARREVEALRDRLRTFGGGDEHEGLRRIRARRGAANQAAQIMAELEHAHPDLDALRLRIEQAERRGEDWVVDEEALARRRVRLPEMTRRVEALARAEAALDQEIRQLAAGETLDRTDGEIAVHEEQIRRLERERDRRHVLARILREADRRVREDHQPELVQRAGAHLARITGGRYSRLLLADGTGDVSLRVRSDDAPRPVPVEEPLSTGAREQVYLALRLAAIDQLDRDGDRLPVFLDETLVNWDAERRGRGLDLLAEIAGSRQLFVFTCHEEAAQRLAARGARVVRLEPPR